MEAAQAVRITFTQEHVRQYLHSLEAKGRAPGTLQTYRRCLTRLLCSLPEDGSVGPDTLPAWQGQLLAQGYHPSTVNTCLSVANNFLSFLGRRDLQLPQALETGRDGPAPALTRGEYLRLLQAARSLGKERVYLLVKLFAVTGCPIQEISKLTVQALDRGEVLIAPGGAGRLLRIPPSFLAELTAFARRGGITAGPLFRTRSGTPLSRTNISDAIRALARDARVPPEICNPRCLRRLFLETQESIARDLRHLARQVYDRLLEEEQLTAGWETPE